ncbi:hypothetical protein [Thermasporomyces composti]|jgi:hypothetical protein|uniref:DUF4389 domain-containing protein n=1 Tax=Thermasporomyces composti TaxID=696763 RepID=A0A3D9VIR2_THECX|nr:hypothetical protein [Thermasporomyces composti]REF38104.1 hypothetical protein DFJ64_3574 [Thermasporomyces composti]
MRLGRTVLVFLAAVVALSGFGAVVVGSVLLWSYGTQRDADGFLFGGVNQFSSAGYAVTSTSVDLHAKPGELVWLPGQDLTAVRIDVARTDDGPVFVGIAPRPDVDRYLRGVTHDRITDVRLLPFEARYDQVLGGHQPESPTRVGIWIRSEAGRGTQQLTWQVQPGQWTVVVMNADGRPGVSADVAVGVKSPLVLPVAVAVASVGVIVLSLGVGLLLLATRRRARADWTEPYRPPSDGEPSPATTGRAR